jgi:Endomembrane protein 70
LTLGRDLFCFKQIDGLPAAEKKKDLKTNDVFYDMGFNLGIDDGEYFAHPALNNHYDIVLQYHSPTPGTYRVVGVLVWPVRFVYCHILTNTQILYTNVVEGEIRPLSPTVLKKTSRFFFCKKIKRIQ